MADYFIRIYVPEELNDKMDDMIASSDQFQDVPNTIQLVLMKLGIPKSSVEWDIEVSD